MPDLYVVKLYVVSLYGYRT